MGSTIYVFGHDQVCILCKRFILNAGIVRVLLQKDHEREDPRDRSAGVAGGAVADFGMLAAGSENHFTAKPRRAPNRKFLLPLCGLCGFAVKVFINSAA